MEPTVKFKGGGSFITKPQQFSADGQTIFVAWKNLIVSYNTKTAKRLRELWGLQDSVAGFQVHSLDNHEYVTACSTTGEIVSWKVDIGYRVLKTCIPGNYQSVETFNLITREENDNNMRFLITWAGDCAKETPFALFDLTTKKLQLLQLKLNRSKYSVAVNRGDDPYFVAVQERKLYFIKFRNSKRTYRHGIDKGKFFTCVACHAEEECVITGDSLGRVTVWFNLTEEPSRAIYHWHTLPVRCVSFSTSGTNFYSGAAESVLVKWNIDDPHHKEFLPRLPSSLEHIAVANNNLFVAVATGDNGIRVLDSRLETISVIQHLVLGNHFPAGILYDGRRKAMVLNGLTGHVQFYSPNDSALLYNLDIVGHNKLTQERNCHIENTNVTKIAIDNGGSWLATVEERVDVSYSFELRLKFWEFNVVKQLFQLNTSVELPHERSITGILFQPSYTDEVRCVTVGNDKKFKVWELANADTVYRESNAWNCSRVGFYRDLPCNALSFSSDGSLFVVGFGPTITAWLPETCELKCSLLHPANRERLTTLQFGVANECHLVVATTAESLSVWNLLSLSMVWTVPLQTSLLIGNPVFPHMAVFTTDKKLFIFHPGSSEPVHIHSLDTRIGDVVAATFVPTTLSTDNLSNWYQGSQLFFITSKQELFCLDADEDQNETIDILNENVSNSLFSSMMAKSKSHSVKNIAPVKHRTHMSSHNKQLKNLLDAPVHTMVPIRLTCGSILRSIVLEHNLPIK